jgi:RHS repeat-associated protein
MRTSATPYGFAGGYTDPTGLVYMLHRYYNPATGQFLSVDPDLSDTLEPYAYALGDPVNSTDPTGERPIPPPDTGGGWKGIGVSGHTCREGNITAWCNAGGTARAVQISTNKPPEVVDTMTIAAQVDPGPAEKSGTVPGPRESREAAHLKPDNIGIRDLLASVPGVR